METAQLGRSCTKARRGGCTPPGRVGRRAHRQSHCPRRMFQRDTVDRRCHRRSRRLRVSTMCSLIHQLTRRQARAPASNPRTRYDCPSAPGLGHTSTRTLRCRSCCCTSRRDGKCSCFGFAHPLEQHRRLGRAGSLGQQGGMSAVGRVRTCPAHTQRIQSVPGWVLSPPRTADKRHRLCCGCWPCGSNKANRHS